MQIKSRALFAPIALCLILVVSGSLMWNLAGQESAIMDELAHIPAGYTYAKFLDYRLNPEHPPLLKALAALPLLSLPISFPATSAHWTHETNAQWDIGTIFLYDSGNNADQMISLARIFPILLTLLTVVLIYVWAKDVMGSEWGLLPAFLFGLSPTVLAHGHYVTTDLAAAFGFLLASFYFVRYLTHQSKKNLLYAGIALGIAELTKFSTVLLIPLFVMLAGFFLLGETIRKKDSGDEVRPFRFFTRGALRYAGKLAFMFAIALAVIVAAYAVLTLHYPIEKQIHDTQYLLGDFFKSSPLASFEIALASNPITRPIAHYFLGIMMVLQRSSGGNTAYFLGTVTNTGWWYYFPVVFLLKEPIPSLLLILLALSTGLASVFKKSPFLMSRMRRLGEYLGIHFAEFAMLFIIAFYWTYSMHSNLNIGVRHLLPTLPFIYILAALGVRHWILAKEKGRLVRASTAGLCAIWFIGETVAAYPYLLSYTNEITGGTQNGYRYVDDSNYDWGQDLKRLASFVQERHIQKIAVDYFGGGSPEYYLGKNVAIPWASKDGDPSIQGIEWLAVSINTLESSIAPVSNGFTRKSENSYEWLTALRPPKPGMGEVPQPDYRVGTSIFVYHMR